MHCEGQEQQFLGDQPTTKRKHMKGDTCTLGSSLLEASVKTSIRLRKKIIQKGKHARNSTCGSHVKQSWQISRDFADIINYQKIFVHSKNIKENKLSRSLLLKYNL